MVSDHRLVVRIDRAYKELTSETEAFIAHVKTCLPAQNERWWLAAAQNPESEEAALETLKKELMLSGSPLEVVLGCLQKMENKPSGRPQTNESPQVNELLRGEEPLQGHVDALKFRKEQILEKRAAYKDLLARKDRICREEGGRYEAVREVRRAASNLDLSPLVQVDQMQSALRKEVPLETGFPEAGADTPGEGAARSLAYSNRPPGWEDVLWENRLEKRRQSVRQLESQLVEDAIWALYLSIASGDPVPGEGPKTKEAGWVIRWPGTHVLRN